MKSILCIGMKKQNHGNTKLSKLKNIMDLQNVNIADDQCHTTSNQMENSKLFMSNVHVLEVNLINC